MQRLGDELGVTPMALYRYFQNKGELIDGVLDRFVHESAVTDHGRALPWQQWVRSTFGAMRSAIVTTPGVLPLLGTASSLGPGAMSVLNEVLEVLRAAGFSVESATEAFFTLMGFTIGASTLEIAWGRPLEGGSATDRPERLRQVRSKIQSLSRERFPAIVDAAPQLAAVMARYPFERDLDRIIAALESELQPAPDGPHTKGPAG